MFGNQWHKKEKPLPTMIGLCGGATGLAGAGGASPVEATGGNATTTAYTGIKITTSNGTITNGLFTVYGIVDGS